MPVRLRPSTLLVTLLALLASGCGIVQDVSADPTPSPSSRPPKPPARSTPAATAKAITAELATLRVVPSRTVMRGYDRGCGRADACSFGPAWSDDHNGPGGRDGCDTRNNVLSRQLTQITYKAGSKQCVVLSGQLVEPYTGKRVTFRKAEAGKLQIDHLYPLARAWDLGAAKWPLQRRVDFANDITDNLLAVDGSANASKSDQGPGEWLPINKAYRCTYVLRYLRVANKYDLPITRDDQQSAKTIARIC